METNETKFNFKSQICTSREQSERLLALGLKKETADMSWTRSYDGSYYLDIEPYYFDDDIPAWSLGRLLEMLADRSQEYYMEKYPYRSQEYYMVFIHEAYDDIISCIESQIKEGYFNKEYLV